MSRSYKKTPVIKENSRGSNKKNKKIANSYVRTKFKNDEDLVANGNYYKRIYESWDISDWKASMTEEEARECYKKGKAEFPNAYGSEKDFMRWWRTKYKNK